MIASTTCVLRGRERETSGMRGESLVVWLHIQQQKLSMYSIFHFALHDVTEHSGQTSDHTGFN